MPDNAQLTLDDLGAEDPLIRNLARTMRDGRGMSLAEAVAEANEYADPKKVQAAADRIADLTLQIQTAQTPRAVVAGNIESWYFGPRAEDRNWSSLVELLKEDGWNPSSLKDLSDASDKVVAHLPNPHGGGEFHCRGLVLGYVQSGLYDASAELEEALAHLEAAQPFMRAATDPSQDIRLLADLVEVLGQLDRDDEAAVVAQRALDAYPPAVAPIPVRRVAAWLGSYYAERSEWTASAALYATAVQAAELAFAVRLDDHLWLTEVENTGNLFRWAGYAFARSGQLREAVRVLDDGRARELSRRLSSEYPLPDLPEVSADLIGEYRRTVAEFRQTPMDERGATLSRRLQELQQLIRDVSGADLQRSAATDVLADVVQDGWPVVFVNPSPHGTMFLRVSPGRQGPSLSVEFHGSPTAMDVFMRLMAGARATLKEEDEDDAVAESGSYLIGISGTATAPRPFRRDLDDVLPWLGEHISRPLGDFVAGELGVSLILCGPLNLAPVHTSSWEDRGRRRCLVDALPVRHFPSLALGAIALRRARTRAGQRQSYLGIADPGSNLPAAKPEVEAVSQLFDEQRRVVGVGPDATKMFLAQHAPSASVIHLATHARGGLFDRSDARIRLADGVVEIGDLAAIGALSARLVTLSACQTAQTTMGRLPDESLSVGSAVFAAGAACVVATLWSVVDAPAALLVLKMHESLVAGSDPPEALRRAQCWLKAATSQELKLLVDERPSLEPLRAALSRESREESTPPFKHPDYWAGFIAVGA